MLITPPAPLCIGLAENGPFSPIWCYSSTALQDTYGTTITFPMVDFIQKSFVNTPMFLIRRIPQPLILEYQNALEESKTLLPDRSVYLFNVPYDIILTIKGWSKNRFAPSALIINA